MLHVNQTKHNSRIYGLFLHSILFIPINESGDNMIIAVKLFK